MRILMPFVVMTFTLLSAHANQLNESSGTQSSRRQEISESSCKLISPLSVSFREEIIELYNDNEYAVAIKDKLYSAVGLYTYGITDHSRVFGVDFSSKKELKAVIFIDELGIERRLATTLLNTASRINLGLATCQ